jgi:hypothetical protein
MYMLNLLFTWPAGGIGNGRFVDYSVSPGQTPLQTSKVWLQLTDLNGKAVADPTVTNQRNPLNPNWFAPGWAPDSLGPNTKWTPIGDDGSLLLSKASSPGPGYICVRYAPAPAVSPLVNPQLSSNVMFGREPKALQKFSSPFTIPTGDVQTNCTVFATPLLSPNTPLVNPFAWFVTLNQIVNAPSPGPISYHFEFLVGAVVGAGGLTYTFSHDPEMDVSA